MYVFLAGSGYQLIRSCQIRIACVLKFNNQSLTKFGAGLVPQAYYSGALNSMSSSFLVFKRIANTTLLDPLLVYRISTLMHKVFH